MVEVTTWLIGFYGGLFIGPGFAFSWYVKERISGFVRATRRSSIDGAILRDRLFGMIKLEGKIKMGIAAEALGTIQGEIKNLIYELVGQNALEGKFEGDEFLITSDIASAISLLEKSFADWDEKTSKQMGKA